jgi:hypothetical protein
MKAIEYLRRAGERLAALTALRPALDYFTAATDLLKTIEDLHVRDREEARICMAALGPTAMAFGEASVEQERLSARTLELGARLNDHNLRFIALTHLADAKFVRALVRADFDGLINEMRTIAGQLGEPLMEAQWLFWGAVVDAWSGQFQTAFDNLTRGLSMHSGLLAGPSQHYTVPVALFHAYAGFCQWFLGYPDQALTNTHQATKMARETRFDYVVAL